MDHGAEKGTKFFFEFFFCTLDKVNNSCEMDAPSPISALRRKRRRVLSRLVSQRAGSAQLLPRSLATPCVAVLPLGEKAVVAAHELACTMTLWGGAARDDPELLAMQSCVHAFGATRVGLAVGMDESVDVLDYGSFAPTWTAALATLDLDAGAPASSLLLALCPRGCAKVFDVRTQAAVVEIDCCEDAAMARFALNAVVTCSRAGDVVLVDLRRPAKPAERFDAAGPPVAAMWAKSRFAPAFKRHTGNVAGLCAVDGFVVTAGSTDGVVKAWRGGHCVQTWSTGALRPHSPAPSGSGGFFAVVGDNGVGEFNCDSGEQVRTLQRSALLPSETCVAWDADEGRLVAGQLTGGAVVWGRHAKNG